MGFVDCIKSTSVILLRDVFDELSDPLFLRKCLRFLKKIANMIVKEISLAQK